MCNITNKLSYQEQLEKPEWLLRRKTILERDNHACSFCGKGPSRRIQFRDSFIAIGLDFSKEMIDCSKTNVSNPILFRDYIKAWKNKKVTLGALPVTGNIGMLSFEGFFIYTVWSINDDNWKNIDYIKETYIAKIVCADGYVANVLFVDEKDLVGLELPRIYIQKSPIVLQVHHKRYIVDRFAWEYEDNDLVTLCNECHAKVHKFLPVQVYAKTNGVLRVLNYTPCLRCNGTGYFPEYRYIHNGVCFRCHGNRFEELITNENTNNEF